MLLGMLEDESKVRKRCKGYVSKSETKKKIMCVKESNRWSSQCYAEREKH